MIALHPNERILSVNRKVWYVFAAAYSIGVGLMLLPLIIVPTIGALFPVIRETPSLINILFLASTLWMWCIWVWLFLSFAAYYLDIFVVTNERVVHIEQKNLFNRVIAEVRLSRIQDITITIAGLFPTMLHYGDIRIQTAAEVSEFAFTQVTRPERLKELIMQEHRHAVAEESTLGRKSVIS